MTLALLTTNLSPSALAALDVDFGWKILSSQGPEVLSGNGYDPAAVGALVVEAELIDRDVLARFPGLSLVGCVRGNPVNVDAEEATRRGVVVVGSPARNAESVADLVLGLMLSVMRHIAHTHHLIVSRALTEDREEDRKRKDVVWRPSDPTGPIPYRIYKGPELATLTLGLLGFGAIGRRVATKGIALGMRVLVYDPFVPESELAAAGVEPVEFDELFRRADVMSLHAPSQPGRPLVGERELALMKPTAYVINTARASVLDYDALIGALRDGKLAGAGLDVFPDEPLSSHSPLLDMTNVTLTPHIGGASSNVVDHHSEILLGSLYALAQGKPEAAHLKNPEVLTCWADGIPPALAGARHSVDGAQQPSL
ncbi:MAG: NAD(P)-dependent oxidoreductase [Acidimicrobiales bacterium]|jgi:D-3-phosphoglycerate dehydrogenase